MKDANRLLPQFFFFQSVSERRMPVTSYGSVDLSVSETARVDNNTDERNSMVCMTGKAIIIIIFNLHF